MMELFQELGCHLANGIHFNPASMTSLHTTSQEHLSTTTADAIQVFSRPHNIPNNHHQLHLHHELALEGMDETRLFQLAPTACSNSTAISNINPSLNDANSSIGLSTISNFSSRQQHFSEILNAGCASTSPACRLKRRSWQEALSCSAANQTLQLKDLVGMSRSANTLVRPALDLQHPTDELTSVDKILNLHNLESGVINHTSTDLINSTSLTVTGSTAKALPPQESLIAAHDKKSMLALSPSNAGTFLSALSLGDEAFFKQQLLIPLEECKDKSINLQIAAATHDSAVFEDSEQQLYDAVHDPNHMRQKHMHLQHGFSNGVKIPPVQTNLVMVEQLIWGHEEGRSIVTNISTRKPKMGSSTKIARPSSSAFVSEIHKKHGEDDDENHVRTSQNSTQDHQIGGREDSHGRRLLGSANIGEILDVNVEGSKSKKRSLCNTDLGSASNSIMALSKRAHLEPHTRDNSYPRSSSSSTSLTITSSVMTGSTIMKSNGKASGRSSRHPLGPALNTNLKPRARQGTANDTQTVAARNRRDRINARLKVLQELVPNGAKVDLVTMLEKAINYVKFLQLQLRVLSNDKFWEANVEKDLDKVAMHEFEDISTCCHTRSTTTS